LLSRVQKFRTEVSSAAVRRRVEKIVTDASATQRKAMLAEVAEIGAWAADMEKKLRAGG
jgi:hypothetical protein